MLFKQGDVAAKLEKKSELYKTFPHFYKMKIPTNHPYPYRNRKVGGVHQMKVTTFFRVNLLKPSVNIGLSHPSISILLNQSIQILFNQSMSITWKCLLKVKSNPFANSTSYSFFFISSFVTA